MARTWTILLWMAAGLLTGCGNQSGDFRVLVFSKTSWYRHDAIPAINEALVKLGAEHGFEVDATEDPATFTPENLRRYRVVVFNNTTDIGKSLEDSHKEAFIDWFRRGGGYVGLHAASVHHKTWPWYEQMLGTDFNSDTERQPGRVLADPEGRDHPAVRHWPAEQTVAEEWMHYESSVRGTLGTTVLLTLDESSIDTTVKPYFRDKGGRPMGGDHPISWARKYNGGRVFYTNFGHDEHNLLTEPTRSHILAGLLWAARAGS
jgi:type 1 glutamine amidotransferase